MLGVSIDEVWNAGPFMAPKPTKTSRDAVPIGHVSNMTRGNTNHMIRGEFHDANQQQGNQNTHHQIARRPQMQIAPPQSYQPQLPPQQRTAPPQRQRPPPEPEFDPEYVSDLEKAFNYLERQNAALQRELEKRTITVAEKFTVGDGNGGSEVKCQRDYWNLTLLIVIIVLLLILIVIAYRSHDKIVQRLTQFSQIPLLGPQASLL